MLRYYKYQSNSGIESARGKWFLRIKYGETVELEGLAKHMSEHNTPYSKGTIYGVLKDMVACAKELMLDSKKVKIGDLAILSLGVHCKGADDPNSATVANIRGFSFNAQGTGEMQGKAIAQHAKLRELDEYAVSSGQKG